MNVTTARRPLAIVAEALRRAWSADTSLAPDWDCQHPDRGQCAVTALIVQDYIGGQLLRAVVGTESHYWNVVDGREVDLTRSQFAEFDPGPIEARPRQYVLSFPATKKRYDVLTQRVEAALEEMS